MWDDATLDLATIETLRALQPEGMGDIIGELLDMFRKTAPPLLQQLRVAAERGDSEALYKTAHSLKGTSAALGAAALAAQAKEIEMMGRMRNLQDVTTQVALVEQEYARALDALEQQLVK
ncbi:MAG: Hpt domain-containing protein [Chloroflexi bacterium]|nr:Hpt domain-containing protein [Chloroflexota bacterium]